MDRRTFGVFFALSLLVNGFCLPSHLRLRRQVITSPVVLTPSTVLTVNDVLTTHDVKTDLPPSVPIDPSDDDEDDDDFIPAAYPPTPAHSGGGSSIVSLLNVIGAILPGSSSASIFLRNLLKNLAKRLAPHVIIRREINNIDFNYVNDLKPPPFQRQEENSESDSKNESIETDNEESDERNSNQELDSNMESEEGDYDEPPEGDGQGGGLLGLLAGLSGGEDGQSDLGSLLSAFSGIIANLSGDGIDLNSLIASGIGLFVGILSEGNENPGSVIASYFLTSLDTITGGGAKNNGAFFGNLLSKLVKGTSAGGDPDASSEENGDQPQMKDSAGFFGSLLMALLGNMSKGSSDGSSNPWRRYFIDHRLND